jgi:LemA protein
MSGWIAGAALALVLVWAVATYNRLVKKKNQVREGWSGIDVQLKRRYNLIPNLVETVKGYATHEKATLAEVTEMRGKATGSGTPVDRAQAEGLLSQLLGRLLAVAEAYPDLKASANFAGLQQELSDIEEQIQLARRYYNGSVRELNVLVQSFPSNLIAQAFGFAEADYFVVELATHREVPQVKFE